MGKNCECAVAKLADGAELKKQLDEVDRILTPSTATSAVVPTPEVAAAQPESISRSVAKPDPKAMTAQELSDYLIKAAAALSGDVNSESYGTFVEALDV